MTAAILPFPYGGRFGRSAHDPMPPPVEPALQPLKIRVAYRNRKGEIVESVLTFTGGRNREAA